MLLTETSNSTSKLETSLIFFIAPPIILDKDGVITFLYKNHVFNKSFCLYFFSMVDIEKF